MIVTMYPVRQTDKAQREQIAQEAAQWQAQLVTGRADPAAFEQWRAQSPAHAIAMARVIAAWESIDTRSANVRTPALGRRRFIRTAGAIVTGGLAVGFLASRAAAWPRAETAIGERRLVALPDGSRAMLNTDSAVTWHENRDRLRIRLERGEIALQLAGVHAAWIEAGEHEAMLSPGRFDARFEREQLEVVVLDGSARMRAGGTAQAGHRQVLLLGPAGGTAMAAAERIERAVAWQSGEILFQDEPLGDAVADYNRYLQRKIVIADPALAVIRVGGRFTTTDPAPFLRGLQQGLGIRVDVKTNGFLLRRS